MTSFYPGADNFQIIGMLKFLVGDAEVPCFFCRHFAIDTQDFPRAKSALKINKFILTLIFNKVIQKCLEEKAAVTKNFYLIIFIKHINCPGLPPGELVFSGANRWVVLP